jgi:hypothetical protein
MVTNYDQSNYMTLRSLGPLLRRIRQYKRIFSADLLGLPDDREHPLSALTMVILARKIMGMGTTKLLTLHSFAKRRQAGLRTRLTDPARMSPIEEGELMELLTEGTT